MVRRSPDGSAGCRASGRRNPLSHDFERFISAFLSKRAWDLSGSTVAGRSSTSSRGRGANLTLAPGVDERVVLLVLCSVRPPRHVDVLCRAAKGSCREHLSSVPIARRMGTSFAPMTASWAATISDMSLRMNCLYWQVYLREGSPEATPGSNLRRWARLRALWPLSPCGTSSWL
jgi:hypothetical protein